MIVEKNTAVSFVPVIVLLGTLIATLIVKGADSILDLSPLLMGIASAVALILGLTVLRRPVRLLRLGMLKSARQIIPAIPILLLIGTLSATWMLSGTVPLMIDFGLSILHPRFFLPAACAVCALVSVVTGSSWTTIATIGVAFMGIGTIMGFQPAWVAGAIISGAYFGDKISPLSDTTVLAASTCNVNIFTHIRYMMITTVPAMTIALIV
ncbi:MAG: sodium:proton antiporter, partial [Paramuribaculum sp.]|nr:sodium:proton antiporter [Paramuribaculum sp.]